MSRYSLVLNPHTLIKHRRTYAAFRAALKNLSVEVFESRSAADITQLTRAALEKGSDFILPVGGDGTLSLAATAFMDDDRNLFPEAALIPTNFGTGHDFYNGFVGAAWQGRWDWIEDLGDLVKVSVGSYHSGEKPRYFLNSLSFGISSRIIEKRSLSRYRFGKASYFLATIEALLDYRKQDLTLGINGQTIEGKTLLFLINKGPYIGGGMKFQADADHSSPLCRAFWIPTLPLAQVIRNFPKIYQGRVASVADVRQMTFETLELAFAHEWDSIEADGELALVPRHVLVRILPDCLTMLRPKAIRSSK